MMKLKLSALLVAICALSATTLSAPAAPSGPSAKAAARLKKNPPNSWIAHYLPDDRYKIAGGVWKYVSTNLDTYYHRADSPNMLNQPNGGVIGFPSARAAEEAGYKPDPRDGTLQQVRGNIEAQQFQREKESAAAARNGGERTYVKPTGPVILADGVSTMTVPQGWIRLVSTSSRDASGKSSFDVMIHPKTKKTAILLTLIFPNINVERELQADNLATSINRFGRAVNSSGEVSNAPGGRTGDWLSQARVRRTVWGGVKGIAISPPPGVGANAGNMLMVGRGNKAYAFIIAGEGQTPTNASTMINSFRAR